MSKKITARDIEREAIRILLDNPQPMIKDAVQGALYQAEHNLIPVLTINERCILKECFNSGHKYITRDKECDLSVHITEPKKDDNRYWFGDFDDKYMMAFNHLFKFVKWEDDEAWEIEGLLND